MINMTTRLINSYAMFPRTSPFKMTHNTTCTALVPFGYHLESTLGIKYNDILRHMVSLPLYVRNVIVGIMLSDG